MINENLENGILPLAPIKPYILKLLNEAKIHSQKIVTNIILDNIIKSLDSDTVDIISWIPVDELLPDGSDKADSKLLCCDKDGNIEAGYYKDSVFYFTDGKVMNNVEAWAPRPRRYIKSKKG